MSVIPPPALPSRALKHLAVSRLTRARLARVRLALSCLVRARLVRAREGSTAVLMVMLFPVLIGFGLLTVDGAYLYYRHLLLQQTVQAAALAAGNKIPAYYESGTNSSAQVIAAARAFANYNMPTAAYGNVIPAGNVVLGNWNGTNGTFTSLASSGGTAPDAVQVTGGSTASGGNAIALFFGGLMGQPTKDATVTAIAGQGSGQAFNTLVVSDLSGSFAPAMPYQRSAISAIIDCITAQTPDATQFGIIGFDGHSSVQYPFQPARANKAQAKKAATDLASCTDYGIKPNAPQCSGSNIASGLYAAIQTFSANVPATSRKSLIIITDGVPNADPITYGAADGIYPTAARNTAPVCTTNCTDANLWTMAQNQANIAKGMGIAISTVYYSGDTYNAADQATYAAALATLTGNGGIALVAPNQATIASHYAGFCATIPSAVKAFR